MRIVFRCIYLFYVFNRRAHGCTTGSYTNIESRDSPLCGSYSIIDETEHKLAYKKSVFKKKSTSSTATVKLHCWKIGHRLESYFGRTFSVNGILHATMISIFCGKPLTLFLVYWLTSITIKPIMCGGRWNAAERCIYSFLGANTNQWFGDQFSRLNLINTLLPRFSVKAWLCALHSFCIWVVVVVYEWFQHAAVC